MSREGKHFINNLWVQGTGKVFTSENPYNGDTLWQGHAASTTDVQQAVVAAKEAFPAWSALPIETRIEYLNRYQNCLKERRAELAETISKEIGKPLWEADTEIGAMIHKIPLSIQAYHERCKVTIEETTAGIAKLRHKPHGVVAVFGPFNFPGHLPNGHIVPALLAGNTIVLKPSEYAPLMAEKMVECWEKVNLPKGVLNLVQGLGETGKILSEHPELQGVFFTGSYRVGSKLSEQFSLTPEKILALEMGGNNPLVVHNISEQNIDAAVYNTLQSAYITAGQRCTCARRLIVTKGSTNESYVQKLINATQNIKVGPYSEKPEPFLGPVVSKQAASHILEEYQNLLKQGASVLVPLKADPTYLSLLSPGLIDVTAVKTRQDQEIFGPLLQLIWVNTFEEALKEANNTNYGLSSSIFCDSEKAYLQFYQEIKAGLVNWNRPTTGSSSQLPFGGIGKSGNHRPSAYYAADYCAYPVASMEQTELQLPNTLSPGISL